MGFIGIVMDILYDDIINELDDILFFILVNFFLILDGFIGIGNLDFVIMLIDFIICGFYKVKEFVIVFLCKFCVDDFIFIEVVYDCGVISFLIVLLRDNCNIDCCKWKVI